MKILTDSMTDMTPEQLQEIVRDMDLKTTNFTPAAVLVALQAAVVFGGFAAYQVAVIVANAVAKAILGRGLTLAANAGLTRVIGVFAGSIGWIITGVLTLLSVGGPAYRVTIPAVTIVAFLRLKQRQAG